MPPLTICRPSPYPSPLLDGGAQGWVTEPSPMSRFEAAGRKFLVKRVLTEQVICFIYIYNYIHICIYVCVYICIYGCVFVQVTARSPVVQLLLPFCPTLFSSEKICSNFKAPSESCPPRRQPISPSTQGCAVPRALPGREDTCDKHRPRVRCLPGATEVLPTSLAMSTTPSIVQDLLLDRLVSLQVQAISRDSVASAWLRCWVGRCGPALGYGFWWILVAMGQTVTLQRFPSLHVHHCSAHTRPHWISVLPEENEKSCRSLAEDLEPPGDTPMWELFPSLSLLLPPCPAVVGRGSLCKGSV